MADLVRRDPFPAVRTMMERFFDDPFFREPLFRDAFVRNGDEGVVPVDIREDGGKLIVEASLPGFSKDEIDVRVHDGVLTIRGQHSSEHESADNGNYYRRERSWNAVSRRIALPSVVDEEHVDAELKNGVLTLSLAIPEKQGPKQIEIKGD